jgi:hypothetical protein
MANPRPTNSKAEQSVGLVLLQVRHVVEKVLKESERELRLPTQEVRAILNKPALGRAMPGDNLW